MSLPSSTISPVIASLRQTVALGSTQTSIVRSCQITTTRSVVLSRLEDFFLRNHRQIVDVPGDGHCILHSFVICINQLGIQTDLDTIKQSISTELQTRAEYYAQFSVATESSSASQILQNEIRAYLRDKRYQANSVDIVISMLSNIFSIKIEIYRIIISKK